MAASRPLQEPVYRSVDIASCGLQRHDVGLPVIESHTLQRNPRHLLGDPQPSQEAVQDT